jgi:hypothetical protein
MKFAIGNFVPEIYILSKKAVKYGIKLNDNVFLF